MGNNYLDRHTSYVQAIFHTLCDPFRSTTANAKRHTIVRLVAKLRRREMQIVSIKLESKLNSIRNYSSDLPDCYWCGTNTLQTPTMPVTSNINKNTIYFLVKCQLIFDFSLRLSSVSERIRKTIKSNLLHQRQSIISKSQPPIVL